MQENKWARLLAYVTGLVNQRLMLQNEYLDGLQQRGPRLLLTGLRTDSPPHK
jgi:hypothetical protein